MKRSVVVRVEVFREDDLYVGVCPDLNVSSFGETLEEAKGSLREAVDPRSAIGGGFMGEVLKKPRCYGKIEPLKE